MRLNAARAAIRFVAAGGLCAVTVCAQQYVFQSYGQEDGLANLAVKCLLQDRAGYLWAGTENGLYRFDGAKFEAYSYADGLPSSRIEGLAESSDGTLWVATRRGLSYRTGNRFKLAGDQMGGVLSRSPLSANPFGRIYVSTANGLHEGVPSDQGWRFRRLWGGPGGGATAAVAAAADGSVWFGCNRSICRWNAGEVERFGPERGVDEQRWDGLTVDLEGTVWARSAARLISKKPEAAGFRDEQVRLPESVESEGASVGRQGQLFVPTNEGLMERRDGVWRRIGEQQDLPMENVVAAIEDREGSVWLALGGGGLTRWAGYSEWEGFTQKSGLPAQTTWGMAEDRDGAVWVGTDRGVASLRKVRGVWRVAPLDIPGLPKARVRQVEIEPGGHIWLGYADHGLWRVSPVARTATRFDGDGGRMSPRVMGLKLDSKGNLWVGTRSGLYVGRRAGGQWRFQPELIQEGSEDSGFFDLAEDSAGRVWAGGALGLAMREGGRWRVYTQQDGLSSGFVGYLAAHPDGTIWIGYRENVGISAARLEGGRLKLTHVRARDGLSSDQAISLAVDGRGWVWLGTDRGLSVWNGVNWKSYSSQEGLIWNDCDGDALLAARDGTIWIGTSRGLAHFLGEAVAAPNPPVEVLLSTVVMGGRSWDDGGAVEGRRGDALNATVSIMTFKNSRRARIRYRMAGLEGDWVVTRQREIRYANMPPGAYSLEVESGLDGGPWSGRPARLDITVKPAWWESWWAIAGALVCLLFMGQWYLRRRMGRLREQQRQLEAAVELRTRELWAQKNRTEEEKATVERQREEIATLLGTAQESNRLKSEFLANMSHEIRTPMNAVLGMTALVLESGIQGEQAHYVSLAHQSAESLLSLLNEILDFSKIEAGRLELDRRPFLVRDLLSESASTLSVLACRKGLEFRIDIDEAVPKVVEGDAFRLRQVLVNLIGNALKFTDQGAVRVSVRVIECGPPRQLAFEVSDTGVGIEPGKLRTIFEPFRQADGSTSRRHGGTGLGLAISSRLVSMLGGEIGVRSSPDAGSVFHFTVPLYEAPAQDRATPVARVDASPEALAGLRVLVAEDNDVNLLLIRKILENAGCLVSHAVNGKQAVEMARQGCFDAILMDVQMPELDGLEATRRIRAAGLADLPILALTANAFQQDVQQCLTAGMDAYLSKPVHARALRSKLAELTAGRRQPIARSIF
jgi:signal transduction histidine kinase/CheY-like chemotaxis protein/streptogramin lyase